MKLIDILVQELPKRGGWPDGGILAVQDCDKWICFSASPEVEISGLGEWGNHDCNWVLSIKNCEHLAEDYSKSIITREQYEAALAASKPEWDGKGLPPVGCECEWQDKNTKAWLPVVIAYSSEWVTVVRELRPLKVGDAVECCINNFGEEERLHFRPIRSEADKKRDEAVRQLSHSLRAYGSVTEEQLNRLYNDIEAGFIPHIRID